MSNPKNQGLAHREELAQDVLHPLTSSTSSAPLHLNLVKPKDKKKAILKVPRPPLNGVTKSQVTQFISKFSTATGDLNEHAFGNYLNGLSENDMRKLLSQLSSIQSSVRNEQKFAPRGTGNIPRGAMNKTLALQFGAQAKAAPVKQAHVQRTNFITRIYNYIHHRLHHAIFITNSTSTNFYVTVLQLSTRALESISLPQGIGMKWVVERKDVFSCFLVAAGKTGNEEMTHGKHFSVIGVQQLNESSKLPYCLSFIRQLRAGHTFDIGEDELNSNMGYMSQAVPPKVFPLQTIPNSSS